VIFADLRHYIATLEKLGQLKVIEGASCELEIGAITEMATGQTDSPAVLFDSIPGGAPEGLPRSYQFSRP
jgi:4-hydroxy-3-polyprenylbenzoate decarboxylase